MSLQLLHEGDIQRELDGLTAHVFRYEVNQPGSTALLVIAGVLLAGGAAAGTLLGWGAPLGVAVAVVCAIASLVLLGFVVRWQLHARNHFVALTDEHLITGTPRRAWRIGWESLDAEKLGFSRMEVSTSGSRLDIQVGGQEIPLLLVHPLAHLDDLPTFMMQVLGRLDPEALERMESGELEVEEDEDAGDKALTADDTSRPS